MYLIRLIINCRQILTHILLYLEKNGFDKNLDKKMLNIIIDKLFNKEVESKKIYLSIRTCLACDIDIFGMYR